MTDITSKLVQLRLSFAAATYSTVYSDIDK